MIKSHSSQKDDLVKSNLEKVHYHSEISPKNANNCVRGRKHWAKKVIF